MCVRVGGKEMTLKEKKEEEKKVRDLICFLNSPSHSPHLTGLQRDPGFRINHSKVFTNAQSQTRTGWHMATLFKCFSMCLWCQHLFHTYLHLKGEKKMFL